MTDLSDHRLPDSVVPHHYDLALEPDLDAATFEGRVIIDVTIAEGTDVIVMNAAELASISATVSSGGVDFDAAVSVDDTLERLTLSVPTIDPGAATITISFSGVLNDKLRGFYRSTFVDTDGAEQTIATTQFESTNARRAFPCWDEPDIKSTFAVSLVHESELLAISSGPETDRADMGDGRVRTTFGTTMVMSTYLLAFVVGPLEATEAVDVDGVPLRVVHPPGKGHLTDFALEAGAFCLRHFSEYFDIAYPGQKLDLVALPDFAFGAMENLGCVTFREALLILDPETSTQPEQQRAADVIAHEIAHMWFGDLVTMKWWNGIWLKEAFATFCEMHATNAWRPEWKRWDDFGLSRTQAFDIDSLASTRPIEFEVVSPADAEAMYDVLTYEKGAAVVRMLEQYLGEDQFRDGIRDYLRRHSYDNTETHDLWDAIEESTGQPARQIMDSWIFQGGYPLISVEHLGDSTLRLAQHRFGYDQVGDTSWSVPLVLGLGQEQGRERLAVLLDTDSMEVEVGQRPEWVVGNADASGFYRVALSAELMAELKVNLANLTAVERYGTLDDSWAAVQADRLAVGECLDLVAVAAHQETDLAVWRRIVGVIRSVDGHLEGDARDQHRAWATDLIDSALERTGRTPALGESDHENEIRAVLFETNGILGDPAAIGAARELLDAPADPARNAAAIRVVAANGGPEDFTRFVERYESEPTPQEQRRYMFALAGFPGLEEIQGLLQLLDDERIRSQDGAFVLARALANNHAASTTWSYIESRWRQINVRYPDNGIPRMIGGVQSVGDRNVADAVERFFESHEVPQAGQSLFQHLERMRVTVAVRERIRDQLQQR